MTDLEEFEKMHPDSLRGEGVVTEYGVIMTSMEFRCRICCRFDTISTTDKSIIKALKNMSNPYTAFVRKQGGFLKAIDLPGKEIRQISVYICPDCLGRLYLKEIDKIVSFEFTCDNCPNTTVIELPIKAINLSFSKHQLIQEKAKEIGWNIRFRAIYNDFLVSSLCPDCNISE